MTKLIKNNTLTDIINYIKLLEREPFDGWSIEEKAGYLTACTSIKMEAKRLLS